MPVRFGPAPPTPWSRSLAEPMIHETAYVHPFSKVIGEVHIGANVLVAPGTSIRADEGSPFHIGIDTNVQDGVVIHGLEQGRVIGDDNKKYSVWIGDDTSITHMALIHGPAYVGNNCFIGFRSTVFNARVGDGCIVMMHALIQDVEIPSGKYVPSGAVITNQQQADRLPNVEASDLEFANHVIGVNQALRSGYLCAESNVCLTGIRDEDHSSTTPASNNHVAMNNQHTISLNPETVTQIRQLLMQGYQISIEHADKRRFRANAWYTCPAITTKQESGVVAAINGYLQNYAGEYLRLVGIDPNAKRRILETVIARPDGKNTPRAKSTSFATSTASSSSVSSVPSQSSGSLEASVVEQVKQLLMQGYQIGTEHADKRRFRANAWNTCAPIASKREPEVLAALEGCINEHQGEYIRLVGIDSQAKRRVLETIIARPNSQPSTVAKPVSFTASSSPAPSSNGSFSSGNTATLTRLETSVVEQIKNLLIQGHKITAEYADKRRFRANAWNSCGSITSTNVEGVISDLETCLSTHPKDYVRLVGVDTQAKKRVLEAVIQRP